MRVSSTGMKRYQIILLLALLPPPNCGCAIDSPTSEDSDALLGAPLDSTRTFDVVHPEQAPHRGIELAVDEQRTIDLELR